MVKFTIPYPVQQKERTAFFRRFGLNSIYAGKHWSARKRDADEWHWIVRKALLDGHVPQKMLRWPVRMVFRWDDRLDIDNHALMGKLTADALKGYLLPDDGRRYYKCVMHEFWNGGCIEVEVWEMEE